MRFHHANLGVPEDGVEAEAGWLVDVLGYREIDTPKNPNSMGRFWFEAEDGTQIHLSRDPEHRAPAKAHVAIVLDDLDIVKERLEACGAEYQFSDRGDVQVVNCHDPAGNRWELRKHLT